MRVVTKNKSYRPFLLIRYFFLLMAALLNAFSKAVKVADYVDAKIISSLNIISTKTVFV
jgi:hypothetical protein